MMAFIGVRISWLMFARNIDFILGGLLGLDLGHSQFFSSAFLIADIDEKADQSAGAPV
jgi:hypothetical protein